MSAEQWERIKAIFDEALSLPEPERTARVHALCGDDSNLCQTILTLLSNHERAGRFLENLPLPHVPVFRVGQLIAGRFRIERFISRGGIGEVYKARDEKLGPHVALKTLRAESAEDREALNRFRREIVMAREVAHKNLCRVFDLVEHNDSESPGSPVILCLTMELLEGESLMSYLEKERPLCPEVACQITRQLAQALQALHQRKIIHRDIKPSNIIVRLEQGEFCPILMDFGLAKPLNSATELFESHTEFQAGAPYFMAPELLRGNRPSMASDIYALGMVLDEMVTVSRAFPEESLQGLYYEKLWGKPASPKDRSKDLPPHVERIILRCLEPRPEDRFACADDLASALGGQAVASAATSETQAQPSAAPPPRRLDSKQRWGSPLRWRWALVIAALSLFTGALALGRSVFQNPGASVLVFQVQNLTGRAEYDYLCQGTTAELMRRLTQIPDMHVIPYYDSPARKPADRGKTAFWIQGGMQEYSGHIRMNVQLIESRTGELAWSDNFDRQIQNPLELQSDIAAGTVRALDERLAWQSAEGERLSRGFPTVGAWLRHLLPFQRRVLPNSPTLSSAALDLYMRGRYLWDERTVPTSLEAMQYFQRAVEQDPKFALAYAAMADVELVLMDFNYAPLPELAKQARTFAEQAIALAPDLPEGHASLAVVEQAQWDWPRAKASYLEALRLNPHFARARRWYAGMQLQFAQFDDALDNTRMALSDDPYDYPSQANYGQYLLWAGRSKEAMTQLEHILAQKNLLIAHRALGDVYAVLASGAGGDDRQAYFERAFREAETARQMELGSEAPQTSHKVLRFSDRMFALYYAMAGRHTEAAPYLARINTELTAGHTSPVAVAWIYAALGDRETAISLLEQAVQIKDRNLLFIKVNPLFQPIRQDPRIQNIITTMQL